VDGGSHLSGFRTSLTRTSTNRTGARPFQDSKEEAQPPTMCGGAGKPWSASSCRSRSSEGRPRESSTSDIAGTVQAFVNERWHVPEQNPQSPKKIIAKAIEANRAREAGPQSRATSRAARVHSTAAGCPVSWLTTRSGNPERCELYLFEARGRRHSQARPQPRFQAIFRSRQNSQR